jgi:DNA-binding FadR family transcriptional regulator
MMDRMSPVRIPKAAEIIAQAIRRRIVLGELVEGSALPIEADMMAQFDVSRPTLREAIRLLEAEGLVRVLRGAKGGVRICTPQEESTAQTLGFLLQFRGATLAEVLEARAFLEPRLAARLAGAATAEDIQALRDHVAHEAAVIEDFDRFGRATAEFHRLLVQRAGNVALAVIVSMLDDIFVRHVERFLSRSRPDQLALNQKALANHGSLVDAIAARKPKRAETIWQDHMDQLREIIGSELGQTTVLDLY